MEKDPNNRAFNFYICCETEALSTVNDDMDLFEVPASKWAVFSNYSTNNNLAEALIKAEMYCHMDWLKTSGYIHAMAPEMEIYPLNDGTRVEYWLPIIEAGNICKN